MRNIILTSSNVVNNGFNNKFAFNFPNGGVQFRNNKLMLQSLSQFYSNYNIDESRYNNNRFNYIWTDGIEYPVVLPNGFYTIADINNFLIGIMTINNHFILDPDGRPIYFLKIETNSVYYAVQLTEIIIPNLGAGFSFPNGIFPTNLHPFFKILDNDFTKIIGFNAGIYPNVNNNSTQSQLSTFTPQVSPVSTIFMTCNLLDNDLNVSNNILFAYTQSSRFGEIENFHPSISSHSKVKDGTYTDCVITFIDQNFRPIEFEDSATTIILNVLSREDTF